jgi:hypothetical protein
MKSRLPNEYTIGVVIYIYYHVTLGPLKTFFDFFFTITFNGMKMSLFETN